MHLQSACIEDIMMMMMRRFRVVHVVHLKTLLVEQWKSNMSGAICKGRIKLMGGSL